MEEFLQLNWGIKEPHELDYGPSFIPDDEISVSYIYSGAEMKSSQYIKEIENTTTETKTQIVPGYKYNFKSNIKSFLDTNEHFKCLVALKILQLGKKPTGVYEQQCVELYNNALQKISNENRKFVQFAKQSFLKTKKKFKLKPLLKKYATSLWINNLNRCKNYAQFYKGIDILPYSYKGDEEAVEMVHVQNIFESGSLAKYSEPTLLTNYHLKRKLLPRGKQLYNSNKSISEDININNLVQMNKVDIVISSSGLKRLINFTKQSTTWDIPVIVKECKVQNKNGTCNSKNVVFIDKAFPNKSPNEFELNEKCFKTLLKTNFCDMEAFSFQNIETPLVDNENKTKSEEAKISSNKTFQEANEVHLHLKKASKAIAKIHHNVSYKLWNLQFKNEQCGLIKNKSQRNSIQVLIRTKLDGCESLETGLLQPVNIIPKVEYHLEYGASLSTKQELLNEWISTYFRPFSQVRRFRTHYSTGEIIAIEKCNAQKIAFEAQTNYDTNLHLGFGVLYKIFSRLTNLLPGSYILHHIPKDGAFVQLLQATTTDDGTYDLHNEYNVNNCAINKNTIVTWHPIDVNFILPKHNAMQQMPGTFKPSLPKPNYTKFVKGGKKKKGMTMKTNKHVSVKKKKN